MFSGRFVTCLSIVLGVIAPGCVAEAEDTAAPITAGEIAPPSNGTETGAVAVFNTSPFSVFVSVNNGSPFAIDGTSPASGWVPQSPRGGGPQFSPLQPAPNTLSAGANTLLVGNAASPQPLRATVTIPSHVRSISALYLFLGGGASGRWVVTDNGLVVASGDL